MSEAIAGYEKLLDVDTAGLPEALREGVVGRLAGFTIVELDELDPTASYFVHESAIAVANVARSCRSVAKGGGVAAGNGLAVTQLWDYDSDHLKDRSIVHAFAGASRSSTRRRTRTARSSSTAATSRRCSSSGP